MLPAFVRLQLAPLVLRAAKDLVARGVDTLGDEVAEWAGTVGIDRQSLRSAFEHGIEAAWRLLIAGSAGVAQGVTNAYSRAIRELKTRPDTSAAALQSMAEGLASALDDPPRIIPNDQKIRECLVAVLDMNPAELNELRVAAGGELAGAFAGTDGEDGFDLLPRDAFLAATISAMNEHLLRGAVPELADLERVTANEVRDEFGRQLARSLDYGGGDPEAVKRLQSLSSHVHGLLTKLDEAAAPFDTVYRNKADRDRLMKSDPMELANVGGQSTAEAANQDAAKAVESQKDIDLSLTRSLIDRLGLDDSGTGGTGGTTVSEKPASKPDIPGISESRKIRAAAETVEMPTIESKPGVPKHTGKTQFLDVEELSLDDDEIDDDDAADSDPFAEEPRIPEGLDPLANELAVAICDAIHGMEFEPGWNTSGVNATPDEARAVALRLAREFALRRPDLSNTSDPWDHLFLQTEPEEDFAAAFAAHVLGTPLRKKYIRHVLRHASDATIGMLAHVMKPKQRQTVLAELLAEGDEPALRVLETWIRFRGGTLHEWLTHLMIEGKLPDELLPATIDAFKQVPRDEVLPALREMVKPRKDDDEARQAIRTRAAKVLLALGDADRARDLVKLLPELATSDGLEQARALWEHDRAVPFFRRLASWSEVSWLPAPWRRELGRLLADIAPGLPEDDLQALVARSDLPMSIREPLQEREQRRQAKKVRVGVNIDGLVEAVQANPSQPIDAAWKSIGGKGDLKVAFTIFPADPVPELTQSVLAWIEAEAGRAAAGEEPDAAVTDAIETLVRWGVSDVTAHVDALLGASEPRPAARLCRLLGEAGGDGAVQTLAAFFDRLAGSTDGLLTASRDGLADAVVGALVEAGRSDNDASGNGSSACAHLREYLANQTNELPNALSLAAARHCVDDRAADGVEQMVAWLAGISWPPMVAAVTESLARSRHDGVAELCQYVAASVPGVDLTVARDLLGSADDEFATPEGRRRLLREFAANPEDARIDDALSLLDYDLDRSNQLLLGRGLARLGSDQAVRALVEKLPPIASARALASLPADRLQWAMKQVMMGEWQPDDPPSTVRSWMDTPGISNRAALAAWDAFDGDKWSDEQARERTLHTLSELVVSIMESGDSTDWVEDVVNVLRNRGIPEEPRNLVLNRLLSTPPESSVQVVGAVLAELVEVEDDTGTLSEPDQQLRNRLLEWLATTSTPATEALRVQLLQDGLPPRHVLPMVASLPDKAVSGLGALAAQLLTDFSAEAAGVDERDVTFARARLLRCVSEDDVAPHLPSDQVAKRAQIALAALAVGQPAYWRAELATLAEKSSGGPVIADALTASGLEQAAGVYGVAGGDHATTAIPTALVAAFANSPQLAWVCTFASPGNRARMAKALKNLPTKPDGYSLVAEVLRMT